MAITIDATAGGINSNSYCTLSEADNFVETNPNVSEDDWSSKDTEDKNAALVMATRLLDEQIEWIGTCATEDQSLLWPRDWVYYKTGKEIPNTVVPNFIKNATAEYARLLLERDRTAENDLLGFKSLKVGSLMIETDKLDRPNVLPQSVMSILTGYGTENTGNYATVIRT